MTKLKRYLEEHHIKQRAFAAYLEITKEYANKIINGHIKVTVEMALEIELFTHFKVTREDLRPDLFQPRGELI